MIIFKVILTMTINKKDILDKIYYIDENEVEY